MAAMYPEGTYYDQTGQFRGYAPTATSTGGPGSTFQPPTADPRIAQLQQQLQRQSSGGAAGPNFSAVDAQAKQLQDLLKELLAGRGVQVGPITNDPEAQAYRVARLRESERSRASEANRLGASGVSGSGDFDSRVAQLNESAGTDIASNEATLYGKRKQDAVAAATTGAGLQLSDLDRQRGEIQSTYDAQQRQQEFDRQSQQQLLAALMAQQAAATDTAFRTAAEKRAQGEYNISPAGKATTQYPGYTGSPFGR